MTKYEATFIINPELEEGAINSLVERIQDVITKNNGEVIEVDNWGVKRLAYEIKKRRTGFYSNIQFNGNFDVLEELKRNFRIIDDVMKYLIIRLDD